MFNERLLAIEDDVQIATLIWQVANEAGFTPTIVCNSAQVKATYDALQPQVVVTDILMPDLDGFDVLNFLADRHSRAEIVIISGSHPYRQMAEQIGTARGLSIAANLAKPFRIAQLREALSNIRGSIQHTHCQHAQVATP